MKFPSLVPVNLCQTPIHIVVYGEGLTEVGSPIVEFEADLKCNFQDGAKTILTDKQKLVQISGVAYFNGDIAEKLAVISDGTAEINVTYELKPSVELTPTDSLFCGSQRCNGNKRKILKGTKSRNPDGTVNYTKLEMI